MGAGAVNEAVSQRMNQWEISFSPGLGGLGLGLLLLLVLLSGWYLLGEAPSVAERRRRWLMGLRLAVILLALLAWFRPGWVWTTQQTPPGVVAVLVDRSESMQLASGQGAATRYDVARRLWDQLSRRWADEDPETRMLSFSYAESLLPHRGDISGDELPEVADGQATEVGGAITELLTIQRDPPPVAVIWMGDGVQTARPPAADPIQVARMLASLDIPMAVIGLGPRVTADAIRDLAVEQLPEQFEAFAGNRLQVAGMLRARGVPQRELSVQLWLLAPQGGETLVDQQVLMPSQLDQTLPFSLSMVAPEVGSYQLEVRVPPIDGEAIQENNRQLAFLDVVDGGARVLYLEGQLRQEQVFLRQALAASRDLQLDFRWLPESQRGSWPIDLERAFEPGAYDAYILGDLDAAALGEQGLAALARAVDSGAGLITLGGYHAYGPGGYVGTSLEAVLPIEMQLGARQRFGAPRRTDVHLEGPVELVPVDEHPVTQLGESFDPGDPAGKDAWRRLPSQLGANRWRGIRRTPGTQLLLEDAQAQPMMVAGGYGAGRTLSLAFDSTFQWWRGGQPQIHRRFWRQALLWVTRRDDIQERLEVVVDQRRLFRGQSTEVRVQWRAGPDTPVGFLPPMPTLHWQGPDGQLTPLTLRASGGGVYQTQWSAPSESGIFELVAETSDSQGEPLQRRLPVAVLSDSIERFEPFPDWSTIEQMAEANAAAGGRLVSPDEWEEVIQWLAELRREASTDVIRSHRLGDGPLESWLLFLLVVGLLCSQWWLRKRWQLV